MATVAEAVVGSKGASKLGKLGKASKGGKAGTGAAPQVLQVGDVKLSAVPKGAVGTQVKAGTGLEYAVPRGTRELDSKVESGRIMAPVTSGKYQSPRDMRYI